MSHTSSGVGATSSPIRTLSVLRRPRWGQRRTLSYEISSSRRVTCIFAHVYGTPSAALVNPTTASRVVSSDRKYTP